MSNRRRRKGVLNWLVGAWILVLLTHCTFASASATVPSTIRFVMNALLAGPNSEDAVAIEGRGGFADGFTFASVDYVNTTVVHPTEENSEGQSALDLIRDHLKVVDSYIHTLVEKALQRMEQEAMEGVELQNNAQLFYFKKETSKTGENPSIQKTGKEKETFYILVAVKRVVIKPTGLLAAAKRLVVGLKNSQWMSRAKGLIPAKVGEAKTNLQVPEVVAGKAKGKDKNSHWSVEKVAGTPPRKVVQKVVGELEAPEEEVAEQAKGENGKNLQAKGVPKAKETGCGRLLRLMQSGVEEVWRKQLGYAITGECTIAYAVVLTPKADNAKFVQVNVHGDVYPEFNLSDAIPLDMI